MELALEGRPIVPGAAADLARDCIGDFTGRDSVEAPGWYRTQVLPGLVRAAFNFCKPKPEHVAFADDQRRGLLTQRDPMTPLLDILREDLALTGAKAVCREGFCGACMALVDGRPVVYA